MLPKKSRITLLGLYSDEIKSRISLLSQDTVTHYFGDLVSPETIVQLVSSPKNGSAVGDAAASRLWVELKSSPMLSRLYEVVLRFLARVDHDLHSAVCAESYEGELVGGFRKLLPHIDSLMEVIPSHSIARLIDELKKSVGDLQQLLTHIADRHRAGELGEKRVKRLLLRSIPLSSITGCEHLLFAVSKCSEETREHVMRIYPNFFNEYGTTMTMLECRTWFVIPVDGDMAEMLTHIRRDDSATEDSIRSFDARAPRTQPAYFKSLVVDTCKEVPLNLRNYQTELVQEACKGTNVVICAPTGSGKTIVGAYTVRNHFYEAMRSKSRAKVCFFVPTTTLVEQQQSVLEKYLGHCAKVRGISSLTTSSRPLRQTIEDSDVVVVTPQLILNLLTEEPLEGVNDATFIPFSLTLFTVLIFDEAHHAKEKHPYNQILRYYHDLKESRAYGARDSLPQTIGMTASLGVGNNPSTARGLEDAVGHVLKMCANLDSKCIARVKTQQEKLAEYMPEVAGETIDVSSDDFTSLEIYRELDEEMAHIEKQMLSIPEASDDVELHAMLSSNPSSRTRLHQAYEGWVCNLRETIAVLKTLSDESRRLVTECLDLLRCIYLAIDLLRLFGTKKALDYVNEHWRMSTSNSNTSTRQHFRDTIHRCARLPHHESELFSELVRILQEQFAQKSESRVMVFASRRDYCCKMTSLLEGRIPYATGYLTGVGVSVADGGQNTGIQRKMISDFHEGHIRVLCATSVGEEGLDISACNLVVQYNYVTNEIAHVQRRGRGRAKEARFVLLASNEGVSAKGDQNAIREALMNEALEEVDRRPKSWFTTEISELQEVMRKERLLMKSLADEADKRRKEERYKYVLVCRKCEAYLTSSNNVVISRHGNQYLTVDPAFWQRVRSDSFKANSPSKVPADHLGEHFCNSGSCGIKLGRVISAYGVLLPTISCKEVTFLGVEKSHPDEESVPAKELVVERKVAKIWKTVTKDIFLPREIRDLDVMRMQQAAQQPSNLRKTPIAPSSSC